MADGNIKGITIQFKGDTTQLGKALSSVNSEIKKTDSALREVDKALKLDPTNVELLARENNFSQNRLNRRKTNLNFKREPPKRREKHSKGVLSHRKNMRS